MKWLVGIKWPIIALSVVSILVIVAAKRLPQEQSEGRCDQWSYFPPGVFSERKEVNDFMSNWFSGNLAAANECSLCAASDKNLEVYRFIWLRSFSPPIVIRAERTGQEYRLVIKKLDKDDVMRVRQLMFEKEVSISESDWRNITILIEKASFWEMPTEGGEQGLDGAEWIMEGMMGGHYHVVARWSPESGNFREACLFFLELSRLNLNYESVY